VVSPWGCYFQTGGLAYDIVVENNAILVVYDKLLKIIYFVATTKEILAEELTRLSGDNI